MITRDILESLYRSYNRRELVNPDPLQFLYDFPGIGDREIAALIASSLAYGRVSQILVSVSRVFAITGPEPVEYIAGGTVRRFKRDFRDFRHRFTGGEEMAALFSGLKQILSRYGSLEKCFASGVNSGAVNILPALAFFTGEIRRESSLVTSSLISDPSKGSACKRLNLFLRWMVRSDNIDPGGWRCLSPSALIVPLDTHMHYFGRCYGFTDRKAADMKTALEITDGFARLNAEDPVKYDFALTRFGIRNDMCWDDLASAVNAAADETD